MEFKRGAEQGNQRQKAISLSSIAIIDMHLITKVLHQNLPKSVPNLPARFISTRMYVERIFSAVFTNFAAPLAPRLNYELNKKLFTAPQKKTIVKSDFRILSVLS